MSLFTDPVIGKIFSDDTGPILGASVLIKCDVCGRGVDER
jgi:hypothetical protein